MYPFQLLVTACVLMSLPTTLVQAQSVTIEKWGEPKVQTFDPKQPPADLPRLSAREPAIASAGPWVRWKAESGRGSWDAKTHTLTVTQPGDVTFNGYSEMQLPDNVSNVIREHELGHDKLFAIEWADSAKPIMEAAVAALANKKYVGNGNDDAARQDDAWKAADAALDKAMTDSIAALCKRMDVLSVRFDFFTDHGRSHTNNTEKGIALVIKEREAAAKKK